MNQFPFTVYDFFAYLACGFFVLVVSNHVLALGLPLEGGVAIPQGSFLVLISYVIGQIIAGPAAWLLERHIVCGWIGSPNQLLFKKPHGWRRWLFPGFVTPLPEETQKRVLERAKAAKINSPGEVLFLHAFVIVRREDTTLARLNAFLVLYGFCRNMTFVLFLVSLLLTWAMVVRGLTLDAKWLVLSASAAIGLFYRYLKFFRQYSREVFLAYAESE